MVQSTGGLHSRNCLLLYVLGFGPGPVEHLEQIAGLGPHARVDVRFRALDVVVQVVPEHVDQVDCVLPGGPVGVSRE